MLPTTNRDTAIPSRQAISSGADKPQPLRDLLFQLSFGSFCIAAVLFMIKPEVDSFSLQQCYLWFMGLSCTIPISFWILNLSASRALKIGLCLAVVFAAWKVGERSASDYEKSLTVLAPPELRQGRFIHETLGVSYAKLPNFEENLELKLTRLQNPQAGSQQGGGNRIRVGEKAIVNQMSDARNLQPASPVKTMILFEVKRDTRKALNQFLTDIQIREANLSSLPNMRILSGAHSSQVAGREAIEFELIETRQQVTSRHVHLRQGDYTLTFVFNTASDADRGLFDEFLKSVKLETWQ